MVTTRSAKAKKEEKRRQKISLGMKEYHARCRKAHKKLAAMRQPVRRSARIRQQRRKKKTADQRKRKRNR